MLWFFAALTGAGLLVLRNTLQRGLITQIGTLGATQVRFLYGLPFACLFLAICALTSGQSLPQITQNAFLWLFMGAVAQIGATALMLYVMKTNSFAITTAWLKGEPLLIALIGWAFLGDQVSLAMMVAISIAVAGVLLLSPKLESGALSNLMPAVLGLLAGGLFGLSAIGFRGAITGLENGDFLIRALYILTLSQALQSAILLAYMLPFDRKGVMGSVKAWRASVPAGLMGASASACLFIAFSLASAAHVRTVALSEVIFALIIGHLYLGQSVTNRQLLGISILTLGVAALLWQG